MSIPFLDGNRNEVAPREPGVSLAQRVVDGARATSLQTWAYVCSKELKLLLYQSS